MSTSAAEVKNNSETTDKEMSECKDEELDNLLNEALNDFNKAVFMPPPKADLQKLAGVSCENIAMDPMMLENLWNEPSMKEAMSYFENSIRSVFSSSSPPSTENVCVDETACSGDNTAADNNGLQNKTGGDLITKEVDIDSLIDNFHKMAKMTAKTFTNECQMDGNMKSEEAAFPDELSRSLMDVAEKISASVIKKEPNVDDEDDNFHNMVTQTIRSLTENNKDLKNSQHLTDCPEELTNLLKDFENDENVHDNFFKFMNVCMKTMKLVVYPSLKDLCIKYPAYLEENRLKLSESELAVYEKQYEVINKICKLFENEQLNNITEVEHFNNDIDVSTDETDRMYKKFLNILRIMKEIQECGQIPQELVEKRTKLFDIIATLSNTQKDQCSLF